jgi:hypothetical protein
MGLEIAFPAPQVLEATYSGLIDISERYLAKDAIAKAANGAGVNRILIDLSEAAVQPYGVADAMRIVRKVAAQTAFGHVAYLLRPGGEDFVATVLSKAHGQDYFRVFRERGDAVNWLLVA